MADARHERGRSPAAPAAPAASDRGSVLILFPAAVLVLVILAAITVDAAVVANGQRDLVATAEAAANDAASAVDIDELRAGGRIVLDPVAIDEAVRRAVATSDGPVTVSWQVRGTTVEVELSRPVELIFTPAVPGAPSRRIVTARASADLRRR